MNNYITVSAKVSPEIENRIISIGFPISDVIQVGLQFLLSLPQEEVVSKLEAHIHRKRHEKIMEKYKHLHMQNTF